MVLTGRAARSELLAPAPLAAVALLALNDGVLKPRFGNALTGKLSDLALCFLLPLVLSALLRPLWRAHQPRLQLASVLAAVVFMGLELSAAAASAFAAVVGAAGRPFGLRAVTFTRDLTDLLALALVPLAYLYGRRRLRQAADARLPARLGNAGALGAALLALAGDATNECDEWAAPVTFRVEGDCGAPGFVVVEPSSEGLAVHNSEVTFGITLPRDYHFQPSRGGYEGCPAQLRQGGWHFAGSVCARGSGDAAAPDAGSTDAGCATVLRRCRAELESGLLWVTCQGDSGADQCRARLTPEDK